MFEKRMPHILASDYAVDILVKDLHLRHRSRERKLCGKFGRAGRPPSQPRADVYDSVANKGDVPRETRSKMDVHFDVR